MRVQFARVEQLLAQSDLSLEEIAGQCGFRHAEYMSVAFKRRYGVSPSQWRGRRVSRARHRS
jgi:LacI family transcriptional regulator